MCGIVGYVGMKECAPILVEGLRRLEYRGYDSAGLALHTGAGSPGSQATGGIEIVRAVGKLANLEAALRKSPLAGRTGIGHTRWATHGRPSEANAHPHVAGRVAVVHNGIIENHVALRRRLEAKGVRFSSDTDTEIVAHLIDEALSAGAARLVDAVRTSLLQVRGAYAIAVLSGDSPDEIVVAKADSPLVIGIGDGEMLCASDIPALLAHTRDVVFLHDGEIATLTRGGAEITTLDGRPRGARPQAHRLVADPGREGRLQALHAQGDPRAAARRRGHAARSRGPRSRATSSARRSASAPSSRGRSSASTSSPAARARTPRWPGATGSSSSRASRRSSRSGARSATADAVFSETDLVVAVSQSGETLDTLAAVKTAKAKGAHILAVANVLDSAIPRASDAALYTHAGPEIGVASTKCFTTQLVAMLLLAVYLGRRRGTLPQGEAQRILEALAKAPQQMRDVLAKAEDVRVLAKRHMRTQHMLFLGRGTGYPIALEGALKLKEISYIHAEGYAAGEMKHGPIALIDEEMPVVVVVPRDAHYEKTFSNMQEVKAREGQLIAVCTQGDADVRALLSADAAPPSGRSGAVAAPADILEVPAAAPEVLPLLTVLPLQLLAYYMADLKGTDVDQPRNLAKTVTVE